MGQRRHFLFLQGPHGPFFRQLAQALRTCGATCERVGLNPSDRIFWGPEHYTAFEGTSAHWEAWLQDHMTRSQATDIVLYGDARPCHARALHLAAKLGITPHIFEEGYVRPYWVTYERGGTNGNSCVSSIPYAAMARALGNLRNGSQDIPASWGDMREHIFWGAAYHGFLLLPRISYPHYRGHRDIGVRREFGLYLRKLLLIAPHAADRWLATYQIKTGHFPYHLALLQLAHDPNFRGHGPFETHRHFLKKVIDGFAAGAPRHHHLVFKAHPLEDGRTPLRRDILDLASRSGVANRVHFLRGGKLARLLDDAESAVTVNSTAAHQALLRGLPVKAFGASVYARPGLTSDQSIDAFFADPVRPDLEVYAVLRTFLMATSQVSGGFYSAAGRRRLLRQITDLILSPADRYETLLGGTNAAYPQHLAPLKSASAD
ncbi:MAG: capsule biosynthesis protein CapA [Pseudomonadota bacterium]